MFIKALKLQLPFSCFNKYNLLYPDVYKAKNKTKTKKKKKKKKKKYTHRNKHTQNEQK